MFKKLNPSVRSMQSPDTTGTVTHPVAEAEVQTSMLALTSCIGDGVREGRYSEGMMHRTAPRLAGAANATEERAARVTASKDL